MTKYYRVTKDNFLWKKGAIIKLKDAGSANAGYSPVEDIWDTTDQNGSEYISARIVEHPDNAKYFERVYPDTLGGKFYRTKDQLASAYAGAFKQ